MKNQKWLAEVGQGKRQKLVDFEQKVKDELSLIINALKGKVISQERILIKGLLTERIIYTHAPVQILLTVIPKTEVTNKSIGVRSTDNEIGPFFLESEEEINIIIDALKRAKRLLKMDDLPLCRSSLIS